MNICGYLLAGFLALTAVFLFLPINYELNGYKYDAYKLEAVISCCRQNFQLLFTKNSKQKPETVLIILGIASFNFQRSKIKKRPRTKTYRKKTKLYWNKIFFKRDLQSKLFVFIQKIWLHIRPKQVKFKGVIGFQDPYYTGLVSALINAFYPLPQKIDLETVFDREIIEGTFKIQGRIIIGYIILLAFRFLFSLPLINIYQSLKGVGFSGS